MFDLTGIIAFIIPAYIANAAPVLLGGGTPLDLGQKLGDGRRMFGDNKTVRGFIGGVATGTVVGAILAIYFPLSFFASPVLQFLAGFMLSLGALFGDALGSFIKRRAAVAEGKKFFLDSVLFLAVSLIFAYPFTLSQTYSMELVSVLIIATLILHPLTNLIANRAGLKNVSW